MGHYFEHTLVLYVQKHFRFNLIVRETDAVLVNPTLEHSNVSELQPLEFSATLCNSLQMKSHRQLSAAYLSKRIVMIFVQIYVVQHFTFYLIKI